VIVPTVLLPPRTPLTSQLTAVFVVPVTLALNCCVAPTCKLDVVGETDTATAVAGGLTVTLAFALFVVSATLRAVTVNAVLEASEDGAV
jgi:hypothetical protein